MQSAQTRVGRLSRISTYLSLKESTKMNLITCPNCNMQVLPKSDGTCPSCQAIIVQKEQGAHDIERIPANEVPKQRSDTRYPLKKSRPSYWSGLGLIIAAIVIELIGRAIVASIVASARGQAFRNYLVTMNGAMKIQGSFDVIMVVMILIGIILLARVFFARKRASKS
jgi:hypothetical protein